ncbi:MAG: diaminopimelate epimerase [Planctomycetota bacterium]
MRYTLMSGAGNLFVMVDVFDDPRPSEPARVAREICGSASRGSIQPRPDGLILVGPSERGADCAMEVYNADGSRPETCGNGLRCAAKLAVERGHVRGLELSIETDAGARSARVELLGGRVVAASIEMGLPRILATEEVILTAKSSAVATVVDMGNPHCVLFVEDERTAPVEALGSELERHRRFPAGTNVEFLSRRSERWHLRVWERGVGETRACGSGACAAAVAAVQCGLATWPVRLRLPGGELEVDRREDGNVVLTGPVEELGSGEWRSARSTRD